MTRNYKKVIAVVPAFNEEKTIGKVIDKLKKVVDEIIVINDGSIDRTQKIAEEKKVIVYTHLLNCGLGAALITGFKAALKRNADIVVTIDADGQHNPEDVPRLIKPILKNEADFVVGARNFKLRSTPFLRLIYNYLANFITWLFFKVKVKDSQSGFRAFSRSALEKIKIESGRMEVSSEFFLEAKRNNFRIKEIPIESIYTKYSLSKGQGFFTGIKTFFRLLLNRIV